MATGLYWCLVLTECLSLVVVLTASLTQTTPPDSTPVCPGGRLVFTCVTDVSMGVYWIIAMMMLLATSQAASIGSTEAIAVNPSKVIGPE